MTDAIRERAELARAATLGVVAGMRSQLPLALLAHEAAGGRFAANAGMPLRLLHSPWVRRIVTLAAIGELIGDKLPLTPSRLDPGPLAGRVVIGGLVGAAIALDAGRPPAAGAVIGAAGAGVGAFSGYHLRAGLGRATSLPDPAIAVGEDILALGLGRVAVGRMPFLKG